jgi:hypothetical protein
MDASEDIVTELVSCRQMGQLIREGTIQHALAVVAWGHYQQLQVSPSN